MLDDFSDDEDFEKAMDEEMGDEEMEDEEDDVLISKKPAKKNKKDLSHLFAAADEVNILKCYFLRNDALSY